MTPDHADHAAPTRQRELNQTAQGCPISALKDLRRSPSGNRSCPTWNDFTIRPTPPTSLSTSTSADGVRRPSSRSTKQAHHVYHQAQPRTCATLVLQRCAIGRVLGAKHSTLFKCFTAPKMYQVRNMCRTRYLFKQGKSFHVCIPRQSSPRTLSGTRAPPQ